FNESMVAEAETDIDDETFDPAALQRRERHDFGHYFTCHVVTCFFEMANAFNNFLHFSARPSFRRPPAQASLIFLLLD
ncbi:hypothetical protein, partial [Pseudomonas aeruginosa]|uniref:hypothetical protein n=1 Tax=Pseudomonas aeruginosa TaxID=287 RepID=UPI00164BFC79